MAANFRAPVRILFFAYLLLALWAMMNFAARRERALYPSHWFLVAALFWFPWIYSTANLFLVAWPVRGVVQAVIGWWFAEQSALGLAGAGRHWHRVLFPAQIQRTPVAKLLPRVVRVLDADSFRDLVRHSTRDAPVPAWLPTVFSSYAAISPLCPC